MAFYSFDQAVILSTACVGSYAIIRGISCYAGHFYNEFTVIDLIKSGAISTIDPYYWAYVGGFVVLFGVGSLIQFK